MGYASRMVGQLSTGTREKLINAAVGMISQSPGEDFSLRAVCEAVGVTLPTAYHFFGSKKGLMDAVVEHGFDRYMALKESAEPSGDPVQDIRAGWDAHVVFGLANPGVYALMFGKVQPGYIPAGQSRPGEVLLSLTSRAAAQGRLAVSAEQATAHILATNIGVTLRLIALDQPDPALSAAVREGVISAITGAEPADRGDRDSAFATVVERAVADPDILGPAETRLFVEWAQRLRQAHEVQA